MRKQDLRQARQRLKSFLLMQGNSYARKVLIEAAWSYRIPAKVSRIIQVRHEHLPRSVIDR